MNRLAVLLFSLAIMAGFGASISQAQTPAPATTPSVVTNYNSFRVTLGLPTTSPYIAVPATGTPVCVAAMNLPFSNTYFTPQGSDDSYVWHPLTGIGNGSIITPGVYVGVNPYRFFRLYFTQSSSPGASGYEACGDNATSLLAPMLNGIDGVLNTYQELIAIGHPGCASFDANGDLLPTGSACSGGGGSTCANPPSPAPSPSPLGCVVLQDLASPVPQQYNDGQGSAAVAGILQGGSLWTFGGLLASQDADLVLCPSATTITCGSLDLSAGGNTDPSQVNIGQVGNLSQLGDSASFLEVGGGGHSESLSMSSLGISLEEANNHPISIQGGGTLSLQSTFAASITSATSLNLTANNGNLNITPGVVGGFHVVLGGPVAQATPGDLGDKCTMSSSTTCTFSIPTAFTSFICTATEQGATADTFASCNLSGTTVTITAHDSNSATWAAIIIGDPS